MNCPWISPFLDISKNCNEIVAYSSITYIFSIIKEHPRAVPCKRHPPEGGGYSDTFGWKGCATRKTPFSPKICDLSAFKCSNLAIFSLLQIFGDLFTFWPHLAIFSLFDPEKSKLFLCFYFLKCHYCKLCKLENCKKFPALSFKRQLYGMK